MSNWLSITGELPPPAHSTVELNCGYLSEAMFNAEPGSDAKSSAEAAFRQCYRELLRAYKGDFNADQHTVDIFVNVLTVAAVVAVAACLIVGRRYVGTLLDKAFVGTAVGVVKGRRSAQAYMSGVKQRVADQTKDTNAN